MAEVLWHYAGRRTRTQYGFGPVIFPYVPICGYKWTHKGGEGQTLNRATVNCDDCLMMMGLDEEVTLPCVIYPTDKQTRIAKKFGEGFTWTCYSCGEILVLRRGKGTHWFWDGVRNAD